ncbi:HD-GYP domain-containing protein [Streptomyces sp. I05A-00742]|uniref:HD-GYP domain-containing protein n=1 Tax=Streptomyces sp. I05A-00742 TaxID=2732853 RepID=UPI001488F9AF|nr:HD-GYP domain-containing protein [Streptomyces sp. I05A-00742]
MEAVPAAARAWISGAVCAAVLCVLPALRDPAAVPWGTVVLLGAVCVLGERLPRRAPLPPALLAAALLLPPAAAGLAAVPGALAVPEHPGVARRLWRAALSCLAAGAASWVFGTVRAPLPSGPLGALPPALAAALALALVAAVLDGGVRAAAGQRAPAPRPVLGPALGFALLHGPVALLAAGLWHSVYGPTAALLVLLPLTVPTRPRAGRRGERAARRATVRALVEAVDLKDHYTRGHGERVGHASVLIGRELGVTGERLEALRIAGTLHDLGKLGVPTRLLRKDGPLTGAERRIVQLHPEYGDELVRGVAIPDEAREAILHHHERLDGSGYPFGLMGRQIPEAARIVAVADAFDAMTSTRTYSRARPVADALAELRRCAGTQFDPRMVAALSRAVEREGWQGRQGVRAGNETAVPECGNVPPDHGPPTPVEAGGRSVRPAVPGRAALPPGARR